LELFVKNKQVKSGYGAWCKPCARKVKQESNARVRAANPNEWEARRRAYVSAYKQRHPDRVKNQERAQSLRTKFGITVEQYEAMLQEQGGSCVCGYIPINKRLAVDHDHACCSGTKTCGKCIRGLLCSNCNTALGLLRESEERIMKLLKYMETHHG